MREYLLVCSWNLYVVMCAIPGHSRGFGPAIRGNMVIMVAISLKHWKVYKFCFLNDKTTMTYTHMYRNSELCQR